MERSEQRKIARQSLLLAGLPDETADELMSKARWRRFGRGETIFFQGEQATAIHIVIDGWVKLFRISPNGAEAIVNVFTRGSSFGEAMAFRKLPYPVSAEAVTECEILQIPSREFVAMMERRPEICTAILAATFQHLHSLVSDVEHLKAQTGAQRVAEFLLDLADCSSGACRVTLPYDKVLIAGRLGMKPESLSRAFSKLRKHGVKVGRHHAEIEDMERLAAFADRDPASSWGSCPQAPFHTD